jgi:hypothetical protein
MTPKSQRGVKTVNTTMTITNATFEDVLAVTGPPTGLLQLVASGWEDEHAFFWKIATGDWIELRNEKVQPGFWRFLTTRPANVAFSPCGWSAPSESSAFVATRGLWAGIRLGLGAQGRHQPAPDIVPETEVTVRTKLAGAALPPSLTAHEGDRISAFWRLTESLHDPQRLRSLLHRLAYRLGGDPALIDVPHALVAVPGTRCERVHPTRTVHVETWAPDRQYALTEIERWLDQG